MIEFVPAGLVAAVDFGVWDALRDILMLLLAAMLLGTVAERLRQSVIVGYLVAGTVVGPNVLGWIGKQQEIYYIAELGVALLLFVIGLEFSPRRLLELGKESLGTGISQILATTALAWGVATAVGLDAHEALVVGMMIALSSTACVLRMLKDRAELEGVHGRAALGVLLAQDIAVVPMMLAVGAMSGDQSLGSVILRLLLSVVIAGALIAVFYALFNSVVPRVLSQSLWRRNRDLPILLAIVLALGCAWSAHQIGLSPALGAFAGGVLLAVSPFATQVRADVRPLSTVLVTLFFASIGMFGDPQWLWRNWPLVLGVVMAIVIGKSLLTAVLATAFGQPWRYSIATGLCLAQIGEFSFVLATIATTEVDGVALMSLDTFRVMVTATIFTLFLTPYLVASAPRVGAVSASFLTRLGREDTQNAIRTEASGEATDSGAPSAQGNKIVIIGFGPAGQRVAEGLLSQGLPMVAIDMNHKNVAVARGYGMTGLVGDATQSDILEHAGVPAARAVVLALPDHNTTRHLISQLRDLAPEVLIVSRCRYHLRHWELLNAGAHEVVDEEDQVGKELAAKVRQLVVCEPMI